MNDNTSDLFELFARFEWLHRRYQLQNLRDYGPMGDPHRGQGRVLALLKLKPEISQKELSAILDIRPQSLGELLAKLEKSGYILRTPSEADRRAIEIRLTDAGKGAADQSEQQPENDTLFGCLNDKEKEILGEYMERIIEDMEKKFGDDDFEFGRNPFDRFSGSETDPRFYLRRR